MLNISPWDGLLVIRNRSISEQEELAHMANAHCNHVTELLDGGLELSEEHVNAEVAVTTDGMSPAAAGAVTTATETSTEPAVSAGSTDNSASAVAGVDLECADEISDSVLVELLGDDPTFSSTYGADLHEDLAARLEHTATHGISKDLRKDLIDKYLVPNNCKLISAPALNPEIKAAMTDITMKRDKNIEQRQKQMSAAISCLSQIININILNNNSNPDLIKMLMDSQRILCDLQHNDSVIRRNFILSSLKKDMRDQLQNTLPDNLLFGQNLSETIKTAKAISKSGAYLKTPAPKPPNNKRPQATPSTSRNLNWKGPNVARKQPNHPKTKAPTTNSRPSVSSRQSRPQQSTRSRR